jgi:RNA-splicing ligase RtcB
MLQELCKGMKWKVVDSFSSVHNYVDRTPDGSNMIRKGAISAQEGEEVIIPINMRDGAMIGVGKGNSDWNYSAPHGSGRLMKREDVKNRYTVSQFKTEMKGIYSSCIGRDTLDEAPFAYRSLEEIREVINDTVEIREIIRPIYNYKTG